MTDRDASVIKKRNIILADIGILLVALFWGGGFVAGKFALESMHPMTLLAYRYLGAACILFFMCFKNISAIKNKTMILYGIICGILMYAGNSLQTIGLLYTTAGKQSFVTAMYILIVPILSWIFFKRRPPYAIFIAALIGFIGIAMLTLTNDLTVNKGDVMTFGLALTFSIQMIVTEKVIGRLDAMVFTFLQLAVVGVLSAATALVAEPAMFPGELFNMPVSSIIGLLYLITFNSAFAFMLQNICLRYAPANHVAIILSLETVFGAFFAITVAGEIFTGRMILGCLLMFLAIGLTEYSSFRCTVPKNLVECSMSEKEKGD